MLKFYVEKDEDVVCFFSWKTRCAFVQETDEMHGI